MARTDTERLDWLEGVLDTGIWEIQTYRHPDCQVLVCNQVDAYGGDTLRSAIDAAMDAKEEAGDE